MIKKLFTTVLIPFCFITAVVITSCSEDTKEFLVESNEAQEFYSFDLPNASGTNGALTVEFRFNYDKKFVTLSGTPKNIWTQRDQSLILDLSKAYNEGVSKVAWYVKFNEKSEEKNYNITMKGAEAYMDGEQIETQFELADGKKIKQFQIKHTPFSPNFKLDIPTPLWVVLLYWILGIVITGGLCYFILTRRDMPFGPKTFKKGNKLIDIKNDKTITLDNKSSFAFHSIDAELSDLELQPYDTSDKKQIRGAKLKTGNTNLTITISNGSFEEDVYGSIKLCNYDQIKIVVNENKYLFEYHNPKISRDLKI